MLKYKSIINRLEIQRMFKENMWLILLSYNENISVSQTWKRILSTVGNKR